MSNGARFSALAAESPPNPPPTITTRGLGAIAVLLMVRSLRWTLLQPRRGRARLHRLCAPYPKAMVTPRRAGRTDADRSPRYGDPRVVLKPPAQPQSPRKSTS